MYKKRHILHSSKDQIKCHHVHKSFFIGGIVKLVKMFFVVTYLVSDCFVVTFSIFLFQQKQKTKQSNNLTKHNKKKLNNSQNICTHIYNIIKCFVGSWQEFQKFRESAKISTGFNKQHNIIFRHLAHPVVLYGIE